MKTIFHAVCWISILNSLSFTNCSSNLDECGTEESCVRLCCGANSTGTDCADLTLLPKDKKFKPVFKIIKGRPCNEMFFDVDPWEFLPVS